MRVCFIRKLPKLGQHLDNVHCDMVMLTTEWFMCLFLHCLPIETAARVWDVLMSEGAKVIFRVGLTFFKVSTDGVLQFSRFANYNNIFNMVVALDRQPKRQPHVFCFVAHYYVVYCLLYWYRYFMTSS